MAVSNLYDSILEVLSQVVKSSDVFPVKEDLWDCSRCGNRFEKLFFSESITDFAFFNFVPL